MKPCCHLDLLLERSNWESFHDGLRWLCLYLGLLAKHHPYACLGGWLGPGLDAANAWDGEHTCLLDLLRGDSHKAVQHIRASFSFQVMLSCNRLQQSPLCHRLCSTALLHGLHWRQHDALTICGTGNLVIR